MHSQSGQTEHSSLNLARIFFLHDPVRQDYKEKCSDIVTHPSSILAAAASTAAMAAAASASLASISEPTLTATDDVGDGGAEDDDVIAARGASPFSPDLCRCRR